MSRDTAILKQLKVTRGECDMVEKRVGRASDYPSKDDEPQALGGIMS